MGLSPLDALAPSIARRLSQWDRGLWTRQQALDGLLEYVVWAVYERPGREREVAAALGALPPAVAAELVPWLGERRGPGGGWAWPPVGGIGCPGGATRYQPAEPAEVALYEAVDGLLRERAAAAGGDAG
jgi:hypothetical protein